MRGAAALAAWLAAVAALAATVGARLSPPPPRGADAPAGAFSAARALETVRALRAGGEPRPVGSAANRRAAAELASRLASLGLEAELQETFACGPYGLCGPVRNVVARLAGGGAAGAGPAAGAVLLVAHHDSVGAGPGVADDLSGAAIVVEVARALAAGPPLPRPFLAVVTDAEESGLLGAAALAGHRWARGAGAVVNLEARGASGPSILFDTSGAPAWLVPALRALPRPVTTSLAAAVYDLLPNDTDLTELERQGLAGVNLAFAFDVHAYHTRLDDLDRLDPASLQHQGESALALVRAAAAQDLAAPPGAPQVFFDVLGLGVAAYRRPLAVAILTATLVLLGARRLLRGTARPVRSLLAAAGAALGAPLAAALLVHLAALALRGGPLPRAFVASPGPFVAAAWCAGAASALLVAAAARSAGPAALLAGTAIVHAALGVAVAALLPGASYVLVLPALAGGLALALAGAARATGSTGAWALPVALVAGVTAATVLFPVAWLLPPMMGIPAAPAVAALVALVASTAAPLAAGLDGRRRWAPGLAALVAAASLCAVQATRPHATAERPERASLAYHEEAGAARWLAETERDALPAGLAGAAPFSPAPARRFPWSGRRAFAAPAPALGLSPPALDVLSSRTDGEARRVTARLRSPRGAPVALLVLPPGLEVASLSMNGLAVPAPAPKALRARGGFRVHGCVALPPEGVSIELVVRGGGPVEAVVLDESPGLPAEAATLVAGRPPTAVPWSEGDVTLASARVRL